LINKLTTWINQLTNQCYNICIENISIDESRTTASVSPIPRQKILISQFHNLLKWFQQLQQNNWLSFCSGSVKYVLKVMFALNKISTLFKWGQGFTIFYPKSVGPNVDNFFSNEMRGKATIASSLIRFYVWCLLLLFSLPTTTTIEKLWQLV